MRLEQLEAEVLALPKDSQAELLARLLGHLGQTDEIDRETASIWTEEAELRDRAIDDGEVTSIPADEVFHRIRASFQ
jgi:plasmid replication initiation protein